MPSKDLQHYILHAYNSSISNVSGAREFEQKCFCFEGNHFTIADDRGGVWCMIVRDVEEFRAEDWFQTLIKRQWRDYNDRSENFTVTEVGPPINLC